MSWAYLDDQVAFHRKTLAAGNEAFGAWIRMIAHACAYDTRGLVERSVALSITSKKVIARLLEVGLLERDGEHYRIHDFDDWQRPRGRTTPKELSDARAEAGRKGAAKRWGSHGKEPTSAVAIETLLPMANDGNLPWQTVAPSPSPTEREISRLPLRQDRPAREAPPRSGGSEILKVSEPESETRMTAPARRPGPVATSGDFDAERARQTAAAEEWNRKNGGGAA